MNKITSKKLAYFGGRPVRKKPMPSRRAISFVEKKYINEVLDYYIKKDEDPPYDGIFQKKFEDIFCNRMGGGYCCAVSSGSAACYIGIRSLNLPKNSEVIISPVTDSGSLFAITECGLKPVIIDSCKDTYNTSWEEIKKGITKKTSALFLVHCSGNPLNMKKIIKESAKLGIKVIEDCSQAPFARDSKNGTLVGTFGDVSVYSTMYRKNLQTGGSGGIVFTKKYSIYKKIVEESDRGRPKWSKNYNSRNPGQAVNSALNYNTDEISCAIGIQSLKKINKTISKRLSFVNGLCKKMREEKLIFDYAEVFPGTSPFLLPIIIKKKFFKDKKIITEMLLKEGINLSPEYNCVIAEWEVVKKLNIRVVKDINAKSMKKRSFNLFLNENYGLTEEKDIINAFKKVSSFFLEKL